MSCGDLSAMFIPYLERTAKCYDWGAIKSIWPQKNLSIEFCIVLVVCRKSWVRIQPKHSIDLVNGAHCLLDCLSVY